jgi:hypothetical protein
MLKIGKLVMTLSGPRKIKSIVYQDNNNEMAELEEAHFASLRKFKDAFIRDTRGDVHEIVDVVPMEP